MKRFNFLALPVILIFVFSAQNLLASQGYKTFLHPNNLDNSMTIAGNEYNLNQQDKGYRDFNEDSTAGLYYLHARYYDSNTRQFLTKDPAKMKNLYGYCVKDPVNEWDPTGLAAWYIRVMNFFKSLCCSMREEKVERISFEGWHDRTRSIVVMSDKKGGKVPFYKSSGANSKAKDTWFPFYGMNSKGKYIKPNMVNMENELTKTKLSKKKTN